MLAYAQAYSDISAACMLTSGTVLQRQGTVQSWEQCTTSAVGLEVPVPVDILCLLWHIEPVSLYNCRASHCLHRPKTSSSSTAFPTDTIVTAGCGYRKSCWWNQALPSGTWGWRSISYASLALSHWMRRGLSLTWLSASTNWLRGEHTGGGLVVKTLHKGGGEGTSRHRLPM